MNMHEKSKHKTLYFCPGPRCKVISFVGQAFCPQCLTLGVFIRDPLTNERGRPAVRPTA